MSALVPAAEWLRNHRLSLKEIDCVIALMLKILDGKCKMNEEDKRLTRELYAHCVTLEGERLKNDLHALIREALDHPSAQLLDLVYEKRVLAETMISRPVMKAFKARLRREGLLPKKQPSAEQA
ncbi:hypothetical protein GCM10011352_06400 [Marinobacterium zhoushanense]|uniref:Tellurite resistance protein TerB n=1 Tax=Marinobacterium zhoushanense TaxID=1679163 RepID=A0ABQ1K3R0_9GAMM|nr:hypothetical protein [Marinobacterium zhoushanense]GGB83276.1 hypothetical protein GCM10011352_06400 [Marinobacterium zhoushanense]